MGDSFLLKRLDNFYRPQESNQKSKAAKSLLLKELDNFYRQHGKSLKPKVAESIVLKELHNFSGLMEVLKKQKQQLSLIHI